MNATPETTIVCIGAVTVVAEQRSHEEHLQITPALFLLRIYTSHQVLARLGQEAVKEIGFKYIASSQWAAKIISMKYGDKALLPSERGFHCVVRRDADEAALGIFEFMPGYTMDWTSCDK